MPATEQRNSIAPAEGAPALRAVAVRLGVVSFVNTLPLIDGLERCADLALHHTVPSLLLDLLLDGGPPGGPHGVAPAVDVALCSSIDYQRSPEPLIVLPAGLLGCDGPTLTVRLYSHGPIREIRRVFCDTDSHTSVALMRILLREIHDLDPELIAYDAREHVAHNKPIDWPEAMLLIGDKVVTDSPPAIRYPHQVDLGAAWVEHTGLPFVFAMWMARAATDPALLRTAVAVLDRQRRHNLERIDRMIHRRALSRGWPADLAQDYLKQRIAYEWNDRRRAGLDLFFDKAKQHGLIEARRDIALWTSGPPVGDGGARA